MDITKIDKINKKIMFFIVSVATGLLVNFIYDHIKLDKKDSVLVGRVTVSFLGAEGVSPTAEYVKYVNNKVAIALDRELKIREIDPNLSGVFHLTLGAFYQDRDPINFYGPAVNNISGSIQHAIDRFGFELSTIIGIAIVKAGIAVVPGMTSNTKLLFLVSIS